MRLSFNIALKTLALALVLMNDGLHAAIVAVVHPSNSLNSLSKTELADIFLGRKRIINGVTIVAADRKDSEIREQFHQIVTSKSLTVLKKYWARKIFSGEEVPPIELDNDADVKEWLSRHPTGLSYIDAKSIDNTVKVMIQIGK